MKVSPTPPINVKYYSWFDRYVASNSGGSHHAAMVVYQSVRDGLEYKREAVIKQLSIDPGTVEILDKITIHSYSRSKPLIKKLEFIHLNTSLQML